MGIPASWLAGVDTTTPEPKAKPEKAKETPLEAESALSIAAKRFVGSAAEGLSRSTDASIAILGGEPIPIAMIRAMVGNELTNKLYGAKGPIFNPLAPKTDERTKNIRDSAVVGVSELSGVNPGSPDIGPAQSGLGTAAGTVADFAGSAVSQPIGTGMNIIKSGGQKVLKELGKEGLFGAGVGSLAAGGGEFGEAVPRLFGGGEGAQDAGRKTGEVVGALLGGVRNQASENVFSMGVDIAKKGIQKGKEVSQATVTALKKRKDDERTLGEVFKDDLNTVDAATKGKVQEFVIGKIANDLKNDPMHPEAYTDFLKRVETLGLTPEQVESFSLAQKAATPMLIASAKQMFPDDPKEALKLIESHVKPEKTLIEAAKRVTENGVNVDANNVKQQLQAFQKSEAMKLEAIEAQAQAAAKEVGPELGMAEKMQQGDEFLKALEKQQTNVNALKNKNYEDVNVLDEKLKTQYNLDTVVGDIKDILQSTISKLDPTTVSPALRRVKELFGSKKQVEDLSKELDLTQLRPENLEWINKRKNQTESVPVSLRDINDTRRLLHGEMEIAEKGKLNGDKVAAIEHANLSKIDDALKRVIETQAPDEVKAALAKANRYFQEVVVPVDRSGPNVRMKKDAPRSRQGEDEIRSHNRVDAYLAIDPKAKQVSEIDMQHFDNAFSGKLEGTERVDEAYRQLGRNVESNFTRDVLSKGDFSLSKYEDFLKTYEAPLKRLPEVAAKLEKTASKLMDLQAQRDVLKARYKEITGKDTITARFGTEEADKIFKAALSDPRKMGQLIHATNAGGKEGTQALLKELMFKAQPWRQNGPVLELDTKKLENLLKSGKVGEEGVGGLQVLLRSAYGKAEGDKQLERLQALVNLGQRVDLTNPKYLAPRNQIPKDLIAEMSGSTGASLLSDTKAMFSTRTSGTYMGSIAAGRYLNNKLRKKYNEAFMNALYDPKMTEAVLEMSQKQTVPYSVWQTVFGSGDDVKQLWQQFIKRSSTSPRVVDSARLVATEEAKDFTEDKPDPSKKTKKYDEPFATRVRKGEN